MYIYNQFVVFGSFDLSWFTHVSLATTFFMLLLVFSLDIVVSWGFHTWKTPHVYINLVELRLLVLISVCSVQFYLTLATLGMTSAYDGSINNDMRSYAMRGLDWTLQHNVSLFFCWYCMKVFTSNTPCLIHRKKLFIAWYAPTLTIGIVWYASLLLLAHEVPYDAGTSQINFIVGVGFVFVPWILAGMKINYSLQPGNLAVVLESYRA